MTGKLKLKDSVIFLMVFYMNYILKVKKNLIPKVFFFNSLYILHIFLPFSR